MMSVQLHEKHQHINLFQGVTVYPLKHREKQIELFFGPINLVAKMPLKIIKNIIYLTSTCSLRGQRGFGIHCYGFTL